MSTHAPHAELTPHSLEHAPAGWVRRYFFSTDHKVIGIQFLFAGLGFFVLGGMLAMLMRWQLAWPDDPHHPVPLVGRVMGWPGGVMPPDVYNIVLTLHATVMIFYVLIPLQIGAFGNYLIPLKIGARDMAFPFLNGLAFWMFVPAGTILLAGVCLPGGGAATGWTAYPPLSAIQFNDGSHSAALLSIVPLLQNTGSTWGSLPILVNFGAIFLLCSFVGTYLFETPSRLVNAVMTITFAAVSAAVIVRGVQAVAFDGQSCWFVSIILVGFSSVIGAINYITTILTMRCPGMRMFRLPMTIWNLLITSVLVLLATPVLSSVMVMNLLDHHRLTSFFEPTNWLLSNQTQVNAGGGYVLLNPHLFWFYSHPAVYIMILPAMGMVSDILPVFSRKPLFGYKPMIYATGAIAFLGFAVWGHHMFQSGMNPALGTAFAISTMFIAVPSAIKTFNWLGTLWGGTIRLTVPMLNAIAFVSLFVIGGLSGVVMSSNVIDADLHMTYYIVAHIHYVLFGGSTFGIFAAIYFWYPKMFGRMMNERLGYIHFVLSYVAFNCTFFAMHILGLQNLPRRFANYTNYRQWAHLQPMNQFITVSAICLMAGQLPFVVNFFGSLIWGKPAGDNPWHATTLEWSTTSPPPHDNFESIPTVYHGPYEYGGPCRASDFVAQNAGS